MIYRLILVSFALVFATACSTTKKLNTDNDTEIIDLDSIEITVSRESLYRSAAPKDFDLLHTKLEVRFDYNNQYLHGKATLTLKPHFYPQSELILDAKQFDIKEVSLITNNIQRESLPFTYDSLQLKIQLNKTYQASEKLQLFIDYTAKPEERKTGGSAAISEDKGLYFINPEGKDTLKPIQIWTQGETESNSCWFPTIDKPNQKFTNEIYITHLKKYKSLSNGTLVSTKEVNDSLVTDYWKMDLPHAPYLVMMAIGDFSIISDRWRDVPVNYYVEKEFAPYAKQIFGNTPEMMEFFSQKLGFDYPWQKYSQVVVRDYVSGAMENTSATLHGEFIQRNSRQLLDETYEDVISHELFHQWFGDLVTCESWSNIPLNESFATYGEYLWNEYKYGREYADYKLYDNKLKYLQEAKEKNVDLVRFYYNEREDMFDRHSYEKGGLVLHYLRNIIGDDAFFKSLELYLKSNQFKPVEIHQLRLAVEEITGKDMNWFFNEWFLSSGHPVLDINYSFDADSIYISIEQGHNTGKALTYQLPLRLDVWYGKEVNSYPVVLKKKTQVFAFEANGSPDLIDADAERVVLCQKKENKTIANYIFQYLNSPLYLQRFEAVEKLVEAQKEIAVKETLIKAIRDKEFGIREFAIQNLELTKEISDTILPVLEDLAQTDKTSWVRKEAIDKLKDAQDVKKFVPLFETAIGDSSFEVVASALKALNKADSEKALQHAKKLEAENNDVIQNAIADLYAKEGDADFRSYFENKLRTQTGLNKYYTFYYYANFLTRMEKEVVLPGIKTIEEQASNNDNHFLSGAAKGSLKRITKWFEDKKKKAQNDIVNEQSKTAVLEMQEKISEYDLIISAATDALLRIGKKTEPSKE